MSQSSYQHLLTEQRWSDYTSTEHKTWNQLYERQMEVLEPRVCPQYLKALDILGFTADQIPDFSRVNDRLRECTGWEIVATDGLIKSKAFFDMLTDRKFPSGRFIRTPEQLDYLEEPDIFHDLFGHIPLLTEPAYADYMHEYGKGGARALEYKTTRHLARLNWWTIEFGLIRTGDELKIYGAGLISSFSEAKYCLDDASAHHIQFDLERCMRTRVYISDMQPCYFVIDSFEDLFQQAVNTDFSPMYERFKGLNGIEKTEEFLPFDIQQQDCLIRRGSQDYITPKRAELEQAISL